MQCPTCYNDTLTPSEDGKLVCDECGEEFAGYREEEMDAFLAGTAVSNRESQSFQARGVRARIVAKRISSSAAATASPPFVNDELLLCEGVFLLARAIESRLVALRYVHAGVRAPLFAILTCWVRRREAGHKGLVGTSVLFHPPHVLALVCLAAVYVRSPMLPRDLCRLVAARQVPYYDAFESVFPQSVRESRLVRELFCPNSLPTAFQVTYPANVFASDAYTWPPLRRMFASNASPRVFGRGSVAVPEPFPVGHLHITVLRMSRLLGLPDVFGARVLRFIELRQIAVKMARVAGGEKSGPHDRSRVDACEAGHIPNFVEPEGVFSEPVDGRADLYGFPTDTSIQIDFINTMRLCYGQSRPATTMESGEGLLFEEAELQKEWEGCKLAMYKWLRCGNPEDVDTVVWASLPPNVLSSLRGARLMEYRDLVEDVFRGRGEQTPHLWGRFMSAFEEIGDVKGSCSSSNSCSDSSGSSSSSNRSGSNSDEDADITKADKGARCSYDASRCRDTCEIEPREGIDHMQDECGVGWPGDADVRGQPLRKLPGVAWKKSKQSLRRRLQRAVRHRLLQGKANGGRLLDASHAREHAAGSEKSPIKLSGRSRWEREANATALQIVKKGLATPSVATRASAPKRANACRRVGGAPSPSSPETSARTEGESRREENRMQNRQGASDAGARILAVEGSNSYREKAHSSRSSSDYSSADEHATNGAGRPGDANSRLKGTNGRSSAGRGPNTSPKDAKHGANAPKVSSASHASPKQANPATKRKRAASRGRSASRRRTVPKAGTECNEFYRLMQLCERDFLREPAGIGLAWSILRRFFAGSCVVVSGSDCADASPGHTEEMAQACNETLRVVVLYLLGMRGKALREDLRWRAMSQTFADLVEGQRWRDADAAGGRPGDR